MADAAALVDQMVGEPGPVFGWKEGGYVFFYFDGVFLLGEAEAAG